MSLKQHSLFQNKPKIATQSDLIEEHLNKHGEKIIIDIPIETTELHDEDKDILLSQYRDIMINNN